MNGHRLENLKRLSMMRRDVALQDLAQARAAVDRLSGNLEDLAAQMHAACAACDATGAPMLLQSEQFGAWVGVQRQLTLTVLAQAEADAALLLAHARTAVGRTRVLEQLALALQDENRQRRVRRG